jgi:hypothetical protein
MESRTLLAAFLVTNTSDAGAGSLRDAIASANASPVADTISFSIPTSDPGYTPASGLVPAYWTIRPSTPLPEIARNPNTPETPNPLTIDATTQPGFVDRPIIEINGLNAPAGTDGLLISAGDATVRGLVIDQFPLLVVNGARIGGSGIHLTNNGGNVIQGNYLGPDVGATNRVGNGRTGLFIDNSPSNLVGGTEVGQGNILSSNRTDGLFILGPRASGNAVQGNVIGTNFQNDTSGNLANLIDGVEINNAPDNLIGGTAPGAGNVIARNNGNGVSIREAGATGNVVQGNFIGTNALGNSALGNLLDGVFVSGASNNLIGGTDPAARNVIGRNRIGVDVEPSLTDPTAAPVDATGNAIQGNFIGFGLDAFGGLIRLDNLTDGVGLGGSRNLVGGTAPGAGNVISRNGANGIAIAGRTLSAGPRFGIGNVIQGNRIGTDPAGDVALPNAQNGILIDNSEANTIGPGNVISGNAADGLVISNTRATANVVRGNLIGTDAAGKRAIGNTGTGVRLLNAPGNVIGGAGAAGRNIVSGNQAAGIAIGGESAVGNVVLGNFVGLDATGAGDLGNRQDGIDIAGAASENTIGGTTAAARNVIAGNLGSGVVITDSAFDNVVAGNYVGLDVTGARPVRNNGNGVLISDSGTNTIGGTAPGAGNVISTNQLNGVLVIGELSIANTIQGNLIGTDATGTRGRDALGSPLGNLGNGILISRGFATLVGGAAAGARNVISANLAAGIQLFDIPFSSSGSTQRVNIVQGNYIGTDVTGTVALGNLNDGVLITFAALNLIGGTAGGEGNLISGNSFSGIHIKGASSTANLIEGNVLGLDATGRVALGNTLQGVEVEDAPGNFVGAPSAGLGNVISGNGGAGVKVGGPSAVNNVVQNNVIGTDAGGTRALGNLAQGVLISGAIKTLVGGPGSLQGNLISGNGGDGIEVSNLPGAPPGTTGPLNTIQGNTIGTNLDGSASLPNTGNGVAITSAVLTLIGGGGARAGNLISGNASAGIALNGAGTSDNTIQGNTIGTDRAGEVARPNFVGVFINGVTNNLVGGTSAAAGNLISGNQQSGIQILGFGATGNRVQGNRIGIDGANRKPISNGIGVVIDNVGGNTVGGGEAGAGNTISGNSTAGVSISGESAVDNVVAGNVIGLDPAGRTIIATSIDPAPNVAVRVRQNVGVLVDGAVGNTIGGTQAGMGNTISGNVVGVELASFNARLSSVNRPNQVLNNSIGTDKTGMVALGNLYGVYINALSGNVIGAPGSGNLISGNTTAGVIITGTLSTQNVIQGNTIGLASDGRTAFTRRGGGKGAVYLQEIGVGIQNASRNQIGGKDDGAGNVLAGNDQAGVYILGQANSSRANVVQGNAIGLKVGKGRAIGNRLYGVLKFNAADNKVAQSGPGRNRFAGNGIADVREYTGPRKTRNTADTGGGPSARARHHRHRPEG